MPSDTPDRKPSKNLEKLELIWNDYKTDPLGFVEKFWPHIKLAPYQVEILSSVVHNNETWVHSANKMGKTFIAALTAVWWFATRQAKVVTSSATEEQLNTVLWGEIDHLLRTAVLDGEPFSFGFKCSHLRIWLPSQGRRQGPQRKFYLVGQVAAQVESFQGHHLQPMQDGTGTVLFVFEEASSLEREFYEAATSQAHRILAIGNPLRSTGIFYEKCRAGDQQHPDGLGSLYRKVIHISGERSPNVEYARAHIELGRAGPAPLVTPGILSYSDYLAHEVNWPPDRVRTRLLGLFPDEADERLFPGEWLDIAQQLGRLLRERPADPPRTRPFDRFFSLGVDVASGGADETVWVVLGRYGVREIVAKRTPDTSVIANITIRLMRRYNIWGNAVAFDAGGGGQQIVDGMRSRLNYQLKTVEFGARSNKPAAYLNRRAELYGELRKALEPKRRVRQLLELPAAQWTRKQHCLALPPDEGLLREELAVLPKCYDGEGRLRLPPKSRPRGGGDHGEHEPSVREMLGGRSPDRADALALAWYAHGNHREYLNAVYIRRPLIWQ